MDTRYGRVQWGPHGERQKTGRAIWRGPVTWNADGPRFRRQNGHRQRVFCASLCDWLDNKADPAWRAELVALVESTPQLDWLMLTKRPENFAKMVPTWWSDGCPPNVWFGITAENQECYERRWKIARQVRAGVRFISYEPACGPLSITASMANKYDAPDWIISGGESAQGHVPRFSNPQWYRDLRAECQPLGIAYFHKQFGNYKANPLVCDQGLTEAEAALLDPHSNGKGGALLDGQLWREFPVARAA